MKRQQTLASLQVVISDMLVVRGNSPNLQSIEQLKKTKGKQQCTVTIGNFDGVHLGHKKIFDSLFSVADSKHLLKVLITFEPRPVDYFNKMGNKPEVNNRITLLADKLTLLSQLDFDLVWVINFNSVTANQSAEEFIEHISNTLDMRMLFIGHDFRFGKNRQGDQDFLLSCSHKLGYELTVVDDHVINQNRISSTIIRQELQSCQQQASQQLNVRKYLGRNYGFSGRVIHGQKKGRALGFPTLNIHVKARQLLLPKGVYAVTITHENEVYNAMANWGVRPTVASKLELVLEANVFNFDKSIYGDKIYIEFIAKIRDEKKFESLDALKKQLKVDYDKTQHFFTL